MPITDRPEDAHVRVERHERASEPEHRGGAEADEHGDESRHPPSRRSPEDEISSAHVVTSAHAPGTKCLRSSTNAKKVRPGDGLHPEASRRSSQVASTPRWILNSAKEEEMSQMMPAASARSAVTVRTAVVRSAGSPSR